MPEYHVFHQNLRVFAGGNDRDELFEDAMAEISSVMDENRVLVAGFTEVMSNVGSRAPLKAMAEALDSSLRKPVLFATGITAVGAQMEWIAISTLTSFTVQISGKVLKMTDGSWQAFPATECATDLLPNASYQADVRGLAYIGGTFHGERLLFGFMHNMFTLGEPSTYYRALPQMVTAIGRKHPGWDQVTRFLGGDFNLTPDDISADYKAYCKSDQIGTPVRTTKSHAYDFWVTNDTTVGDNDCEVYTQSRWDNTAGLSDHAGVGMRIRTR